MRQRFERERVCTYADPIDKFAIAVQSDPAKRKCQSTKSIKRKKKSYISEVDTVVLDPKFSVGDKRTVPS